MHIQIMCHITECELPWCAVESRPFLFGLFSYVHWVLSLTSRVLYINMDNRLYFASTLQQNASILALEASIWDCGYVTS